MTAEFPLDKPIRELLPVFYRQYNLEADGGYDSDHVVIEVTRNWSFYIPNWDARRKALLKHDVHHIVTGYKSNFKGELEIASWEIGSGCWPYWAALVLDLPGLAMGFWINLPGVFRAFVLGLRTRNLYSDILSDTEAKSMTLSEVREILGLNNHHPKRVTVKEALQFCVWLSIAAVFSLCSIALLPLIAIFSVFVTVRRKVD